MSPEYLNVLADLADPDKLWRRAGIDRDQFTPEQRRQLDMGVALRRQAEHIRRLREVYAEGKSLMLTPLTPNANGCDIRTAPIPDQVKRRMLKDSP